MKMVSPLVRQRRFRSGLDCRAFAVYDRCMNSSNILGKLLDSVADCFSKEVAERVLQIRADSETEMRLEELRAKANEGELSDTESREYKAYIDGMNLVGILQAKARRKVTES